MNECCSPYHEEDPRNCYHCLGEGTCSCSHAEKEARDAEAIEIYEDSMRCWCGACEGTPARCAEWVRNEAWARSDMEEARP